MSGKLLIIGTPENINVTRVLETLDTMHGATFEAITVTDRDDVIKKWGESIVDTALGDLAVVDLMIQVNDFTPTILGPKKLLMMCGAGLYADARRYIVHDEPVIKLQPEHNKPWYQDRRNNRSKKSRRKV